MKLLQTLLTGILFLIVLNVSGQRVERMKFGQMQQRIHDTRDSLLVLNFWATWCKPCVEELPYFDSAALRHPDLPLKMVLVNLDFNSRVASLVEPFVSKQRIRSAVWHVDDTDANSWINQLDSAWSGAIPATALFWSGRKLVFHEGPLKQDELDRMIRVSAKEALEH